MPSSSTGKDVVYQYRNCRILRNHQIYREDLWVRHGKIINPEKLFYDERKPADIQIDCNDALISPGLIDVQINGAFGIDFSSSNDLEEDVSQVAKGLLAHGVTSFVPTVITSSQQYYKSVIPQFHKVHGGKHGAQVLGLHLEGPFISKDKLGAHPSEYIRTFDNGFQSLLDMYRSLDNVAIVTIAPELSNAKEVTEELTKRGIVVSVGHSMANIVIGEDAVNHGATFITHLFNAMLPFHHRDPHLVGLLTSEKIPTDSTVYYGMIADGIHTHPAALRIAQRVHPKGMVLVTDAIPAMGLSTGQHRIGQQLIEINGKRAVIAGTNILCGSIATQISCVRHYKKETGCSTVEALEAATLHSAELLNITSSKGTLDYGTDADFILLSNDLTVIATFIGGELVWETSNAPVRKSKCVLRPFLKNK